MAVEEWSYPDTVFSYDACLEGLGGMLEDNFFHIIIILLYLINYLLIFLYYQKL